MKVYLNLIFTFLLTITIHTAFAQCGKLTVDVNHVTSCFNPNGLVFASIIGDNADYNFKWTDSSNRPVASSSYAAGNAPIHFAYKLKGGNYKVVATSTKNRNCRLEKEFGIIEGNCSSNLLTLESVTVNIDSKGNFTIHHIGTEKVEGTETELFYPVGNPLPDYSSPEKSAWTVVPKEGAIENHPSLKSYEFVMGFQSSGYVRHMTKPVKPKFTYEGANKLLNETNTLKNSISISPQPANDYLNLEFDSNIRINSVEILNIGGQVVLEKEISNSADNVPLNVADLPSGLYLLKINSDEGSLTQKIVIKK